MKAWASFCSWLKWIFRGRAELARLRRELGECIHGLSAERQFVRDRLLALNAPRDTITEAKFAVEMDALHRRIDALEGAVQGTAQTRRTSRSWAVMQRIAERGAAAKVAE